jgi:hypothetical protein
MEAVLFYEIKANFYKTTGHNVLKNSIFDGHHFEGPKSQ